MSLVGAPWAIGMQGVATLVAGAVASRVREPRGRVIETEPPLEAVVAGLRAVMSHTQLRATVALMVVSGIGYGCFTIGLPLWARGDAAHVAGGGGVDVGGGVGRLGDRRPRLRLAATAGKPRAPRRGVHRPCLPLLLAPLVCSLWLGIACMFASGLCSAPFIIAMFSIRQNAVDSRLHGRVFAITVSINAAGTPAGAFLAGLSVGRLGVHRLLFGAGLGQLLAAGGRRPICCSAAASARLVVAEPERAAAA